MIHCFIDLETTGTDPERHAIIQIAGLVFRDGKQTLTFDFDVRPLPKKIIEPEALEVNGKTEAELYSYPEATQVHRQLLRQFGGLVDKFDKTDKMFFVGFCSDFDYQFMRQWFLDLGDVYFGSWFFAPPMDVMQLAIFKLQERRHQMENFKQATVARELGKKALATYQAFRERIVLALEDPGALRYRTIGVASIPMRNMAGTEYALWEPEGFHSLIFNRNLIGIFATDQLCSIRRLNEDKSPGRSEEELPF